MTFSLLPAPSSDYDKQGTESYLIVSRPDVRTPRGFLEESEGTGTHTDTNDTSKKEDLTHSGYKAKSNSGVKGHCEDKDTFNRMMSSKGNQNASADKAITEFAFDRIGTCDPASESRGKTDLRRYNIPSRNQSLDCRTGERSPDQDKKSDTFMLSTRGDGDNSKQARSFEERSSGVQNMRCTLTSSVQACNSTGTSNDTQEGNPVSQMTQMLDRVSRGLSLPFRLRSQSQRGSDLKRAANSFGPKGGQSILQRIEKLYGSVGFGKDYGSFKNLSSPGKSGDSLSSTPKDISGLSLSPGRSNSRERVPMVQCQEQTLDRHSSKKGVHWSEESSTMSLGRERSKHTLAGQIRSARAIGGITTPSQPNTFRYSCELKKSEASDSKDLGGVNNKKMTNGINKITREITGLFKGQEKEKHVNNATKEKYESMSINFNDDVFESNPQKIPIRAMERKKITEFSNSSPASVKNKINQFEALTQRAQGLATGQVLVPRRAFSVPTHLHRIHEVVKKSGSTKVSDGLKDKWESLKEDEKTGEKTERKVKLLCKNYGSGRSFSVDEAGLTLRGKESKGNYLVEDEGQETDSGSDSSEDFNDYSTLNSTPNGGAERQHRSFYIDETDLSKVSRPEESNRRPQSLLLSSSIEPSAGVLKKISSPLSDEEKTPTNTPTSSPCLSLTEQMEHTTYTRDCENGNISVLTEASETQDQESLPLFPALTTLSQSNTPDPTSQDVIRDHPKKNKSVLDLDAWLDGLNTKIKVWNDDGDGYEDDEESTQKDEDSNYDSDSGESSVTVVSNMSQSDSKSFSVSLSDLCNFAGVDYESDNDEDEWHSMGRRSASLSSDMSAISCVSVLPSDELDRLLDDVRSLADNNLQNYNDVQVVVLHKEIGVGLGFSMAGGVDQNKPITVHKVLPTGVADQQGSIRAGDQVLSINGTSLCGFAHWEALRVLRRAKARDMGVVVLRGGGIGGAIKGGAQTNTPTQTQFTETGQRVSVRLEKNSRDLGFSLEGGVGSSWEDRPITVQKIFQGGPVDKVCPGDEVLEIDGVSVVGMRRLEAWTLIRRLPRGPVDVLLRRPLKNLDT